jgi:hypothetical protein
MAVLGRDQAALQELLYQSSHPTMNNQLRPDQQRQRNQELDMDIQVEQEGNTDSCQQAPAQCRQHGQRQPGNYSTSEYPPVKQLNRRPHQPGAQQELIERTAQYKGEINVLMSRERFLLPGCSLLGIHRVTRTFALSSGSLLPTLTDRCP